MTFGVTAQVVTVDDSGYEKSVQVPFFKIDASSEGGAEKIASEIINPLANPKLLVLVQVVAL